MIQQTFYLCICVCACMYVHLCMCVHLYGHFCGGQMSTSSVLFSPIHFFWDTVSQWKQSSTIWLAAWSLNYGDPPISSSIVPGWWTHAWLFHVSMLPWQAVFWVYYLPSLCILLDISYAYNKAGGDLAAIREKGKPDLYYWSFSPSTYI